MSLPVSFSKCIFSCPFAFIHLFLFIHTPFQFPSPDKNPTGEEHFKRILEAYRILSNVEKRKVYDQKCATESRSKQQPKPAQGNACKQVQIRQCFKCCFTFRESEFVGHLYECKQPKNQEMPNPKRN